MAKVVEVAFAKMLFPVHVLLFARSVEEAAVMVIAPPLLKVVPLIVPREPVRKLVPIDVVATSLPVLSVLKRELVSAVNQVVPELVNCEVVALVKFWSVFHVFVSPRSVVDATVMFAVPLNETPLIVRAVWSAVAVPALPEILPVMVLVNVCVPAHVFEVVVPKPRLMVVE